MDLHRNKSLSAVVQECDPDNRSLLWREWLDTFYLSNDNARQAILDENPPLTNSAIDVIVAAGVCWLARKAKLKIPKWAAKRYLKFPWRNGLDPKSRLATIEQILAPPEFFERNVFISASIMYRASMPIDWIEKEPKAFSRIVKEMLKEYNC